MSLDSNFYSMNNKLWKESEKMSSQLNRMIADTQQMLDKPDVILTDGQKIELTDLIDRMKSAYEHVQQFHEYYADIDLRGTK